MKVFRLNTELFLDYDLEYININKIDDINNYYVDYGFYIIIVRDKFIIRRCNNNKSNLLFTEDHSVLNKEQMSQIAYNLVKYSDYDDTMFFDKFEDHDCCIKNHDRCYM